MQRTGEDGTPRLVSLSDRVNQQQAMLLGYLAENDNSFSKAPRLIELVKELARDRKALKQLTMSSTTASYKLRFGLAKTFASQLHDDMRQMFFSLNLDEAVSSNHEKVGRNFSKAYTF